MDLWNEVLYLLTGFAVVMTVLGGLWAACALSAAIVTRLEGRLVTPALATPAPAPVAEAEAGIPAGHLAAIAAAVAVLTDGRGRVVTVQAPAHQAFAWAQEGRKEQFSSHRTRWDWAIPGPPHAEHDHPVHDHPPPPPAPRA